MVRKKPEQIIQELKTKLGAAESAEAKANAKKLRPVRAVTESLQQRDLQASAVDLDSTGKKIIITYIGISGELGSGELPKDTAELRFLKAKELLATHKIRLVDEQTSHDEDRRSKMVTKAGSWYGTTCSNINAAEEEDLNRRKAAGEFDYEEEERYTVGRDTHTLTINVRDVAKLTAQEPNR